MTNAVLELRATLFLVALARRKVSNVVLKCAFRILELTPRQRD